MTINKLINKEEGTFAVLLSNGGTSFLDIDDFKPHDINIMNFLIQQEMLDTDNNVVNVFGKDIRKLVMQINEKYYNNNKDTWSKSKTLLNALLNSRIEWIPIGSKFIVIKKNGKEILLLEETMDWLE